MGDNGKCPVFLGKKVLTMRRIESWHILHHRDKDSLPPR